MPFCRLVPRTVLASLVGVLVFGPPLTVLAEYTSSCPVYAGTLQTTAQDYEFVVSKFRKAKSDFESACSEYGYARNDEYACGQYGYIREDYRNAASQLKRAGFELQSAISNVSSFCGIPDESASFATALRKASGENAALKKRLLELERELERYREQPKRSEELAPN